MPTIEEPEEKSEEGMNFETVEEAVKRITRFSYLGRPDAKPATENPEYMRKNPAPAAEPENKSQKTFSDLRSSVVGFVSNVGEKAQEMAQRASVAIPREGVMQDGRFIAALTTEPPNPSVHTFQGKLTLPPFDPLGSCIDLPLDAENVLLRGAVLRNTEWMIGVAFFTGTDTKLVQNSFKTPSKFSQLDILMNKTVIVILCVMISIISYLATAAVIFNNDQFDELFYAGFNKNETEPWPYLPDLPAPEWETETRNWMQFFLLYVTLLTNFIPLSLYVTVEVITFCMLAFVYVDLQMYDDTTNTRAVARSTIITDLGRIQYIFSDKTGTLTQNVMRFKRCSVDGMAFGAPIQKSRPEEVDSDDEDPMPFQPLRHLLVGQLNRPSASSNSFGEDVKVANELLTFNSEMFLRIMCLCHTVVVEKDLDKKEDIGASESGDASRHSSGGWFASRRSRNKDSSHVSEARSEASGPDPASQAEASQDPQLEPVASTVSEDPYAKSPDGAPHGYAYQAESPDEGALVSAASSIFGYQVVTRDSNGITVRIGKPSHFEVEETIEGLKSGSIPLKKLAAESARELPEEVSAYEGLGARESTATAQGTEREEIWTILAVNKFDSDRKRMSVLLRSPPELGSLPILFCKGADSAMLDPEVCASSQAIQQVNNGIMDGAVNDDVEDMDEYDQWEFAQMLGLQAQLGDFASEGLRTLVLGLRILTEDECDEWLLRYKAASVALTDRAQLLTEAALEIETNLHIAGATAIEDKLQTGVPDTIATLEHAGIKLWVLTGDKRETAVEIGYSTHVLTPKMHVTEVGDFGKMHVRTQMCMEFMSLVKRGRLPEYQKSMVQEPGPSFGTFSTNMMFAIRRCCRAFGRYIWNLQALLLSLMGCKKRASRKKLRISKSLENEELILKSVDRRRNVRTRAEVTIREWLETDEGKAQRKYRGKDDDELSMVSDEAPAVFQRATSARNLLGDMKSSGRVSQVALREVSLAQLTAQQAGAGGPPDTPLVDEDTLSMNSFFPGNKEDLGENFDKKKRTLLERAFAIDRQVRKGQLRKHVFPEKLQAHEEKNKSARRLSGSSRGSQGGLSTGPRALVIEGAALKHMLGDPELEEILFSVAETCEAVIACRVSPKQKALLVNLVRNNVSPTPITLAIGDGANDVGMIQEAHVGVGISGKEGKQAVNASDFAIAQFRFLEDLILIHGRWDFFRLSTVVLFSFYKNAILAGMLVTFSSRTLYSGTPLYDEWLIAMVNFVAGIPIMVTGLFDRCLSKDYVKRNPEVYKATRDNELITSRTLLRWIIMVFVHLFSLYYFTVPVLAGGGGMTSAFVGLMRNEDDAVPGNGEGGDLKSGGTVTFTCMIILLAYKVLYESRSLIHGRWPAFTCKKGVEEGFFSRVAYTWHGVTFCSIGFYLFAIAIYQIFGRLFTSSFSGFTDVANHVLGTRSSSWILIAFVPIFGMTFDVCLKVFSNMFYPTQTQIHLEIESKERAERKLKKYEEKAMRQSRRLPETQTAEGLGEHIEL
uniref:P-type sodium-transporting ATPase4 n=1 Tax=Entomoneis paludosa TaxID=265537 RepID=A0A7S2VCJ9_9STRA